VVVTGETAGESIAANATAAARLASAIPSTAIRIGPIVIRSTRILRVTTL
jgi:hypothetical protein